MKCEGHKGCKENKRHEGVKGMKTIKGVKGVKGLTTSHQGQSIQMLDPQTVP